MFCRWLKDSTVKGILPHNMFRYKQFVLISAFVPVSIRFMLYPEANSEMDGLIFKLINTIEANNYADQGVWLYGVLPHQGVWPCSVLTAKGFDSAMSCLSKSLTLRCPACQWVWLCGVLPAYEIESEVSCPAKEFDSAMSCLLRSLTLRCPVPPRSFTLRLPCPPRSLKTINTWFDHFKNRESLGEKMTHFL